jgi:hypothetical protein
VKRLLTAPELALLESMPLPVSKPQTASFRRRMVEAEALPRAMVRPINTEGPTIRRFSQWRDQEKAS